MPGFTQPKGPSSRNEEDPLFTAERVTQVKA